MENPVEIAFTLFATKTSCFIKMPKVLNKRRKLNGKFELNELR